ncbi:MAG: glycoside hydrolase family 127 protein [Trueperaceae bacterium]|nr:MAG: glycoside hydrolase family 127 protein [Trueperaceae bacterium]
MMDYPVTPVAFTEVGFADAFWSQRLETNRKVTIPYDFQKCEDTGRVDNFIKAAGRMEGPHEGLFFNDSDIFKIIEGASYSLSLHPDPELDAYIDGLIEKIAAAQEEDGYIYTPRTIDPGAVTAEREGLMRWGHLRINHELYNVGHMYEAAVAHYQATGKRNFLELALKNAELIDSVFGPDKVRDVPGHQEVEIGLVKLYRITGEKRYLELAKFFLDERGHAHGRELYSNYGNPGYMQDHLPVVEQDEAVGHAVRAVYMYSGMADVAALTGDQAYIEALDALWDNVVAKKLYLTGGIGARHRGEAFGDNYELPNDTAYTETCAAIANIYWNHRMFLLHGDAKYLDVLERTLYNGFLSGISLSGDRFFYVNPLSFDGATNFNRDDSRERLPWFGCSCCPTNVVRLLPSLPGYVYAHRDDHIFVNLFVAGDAVIPLATGAVKLTQQTGYPWNGSVKLTIEPEVATDFTLHVRIPGWARNEPVPSDLYRYQDSAGEQATLRVNGNPVELGLEQGFAVLRRSWHPGDVVELELPMPVRRVVSHQQVEAGRGRVAIERGPLVYCAEGIDNGGSVLEMTVSDDETFTVEHDEGLLGGVNVIRSGSKTLIPYYAWAHRGLGEMAVWLWRG